MDLLDFGMKNRDSKSKTRRIAAEAALAAERAKADIYEKYLEQKRLDLPDNPLRDEWMLQRILEEAEEYEREKEPETKPEPVRNNPEDSSL